MTWQAVTHRTRQTVATLKRHASTLRARITLRVVAWSLAGLVGLSFVAIATEALIRAHITPAVERLPTAIYTRPVPWSSDGDASQAAPVAIGTLDGSPMEERVPVPLSEVPNSLVQAVLAVEDQRFFQHHGLDLKRVAGAMIANLRAGGIVQGGSTLTQQLAKNLFLSADRTPIRKLREAAMALVLEMRYSKRQILDAYLNEIYLGQDGARAIHGMGAASRYYLGKDIRRITIPEAAQLAAMISAPNRTSAARHPDAARERRDMVLHLMADQRRISRAVADSAV
ncbi:MAG: transglycosylase domain-containing protein, partial [Gemmatimonadales bacterium]